MMAPRSFPNPQPSKPGPSTAAGKETVSKNALNHGLASPRPVHVALPGEEADYAEFCQTMREALAPVGVLETHLADSIAADSWRLRRARAMENAAFTAAAADDYKLKPASAQAKAWLDPQKGLQNLALYAHRIQRAVEKNTKRLEALQAERKAAYAQAEEEAILLTQLAESQPDYDPAADFPATGCLGEFVYSRPAIEVKIQRQRRLNAMKAAVKAA